MCIRDRCVCVCVCVWYKNWRILRTLVPGWSLLLFLCLRTAMKTSNFFLQNNSESYLTLIIFTNILNRILYTIDSTHCLVLPERDFEQHTQFNIINPTDTHCTPVYSLFTCFPIKVVRETAATNATEEDYTSFFTKGKRSKVGMRYVFLVLFYLGRTQHSWT